jgi:hypothetical protein
MGRMRQTRMLDSPDSPQTPTAPLAPTLAALAGLAVPATPPLAVATVPPRARRARWLAGWLARHRFALALWVAALAVVALAAPLVSAAGG